MGDSIRVPSDYSTSTDLFALMVTFYGDSLTWQGYECFSQLLVVCRKGNLRPMVTCKEKTFATRTSLVKSSVSGLPFRKQNLTLVYLYLWLQNTPLVELIVRHVFLRCTDLFPNLRHHRRHKGHQQTRSDTQRFR